MEKVIFVDLPQYLLDDKTLHESGLAIYEKKIKYEIIKTTIKNFTIQPLSFVR